MSSDFSKRIADLSAAKLEFLAQRLREKRKEDAQASPIPRRKDTAFPAPLSFAQQRLWFLDQLEPNSSLYNIPAIVRLRGSLRADVLARCLNEVVRRHEALRTVFIVVSARPQQRINAPWRVSLPVIDLRTLPDPERRQRVSELALEEAREPFDLSTGPLFRVRLLRLSDDEHVLLLTMSHIISDGWSMGVFVREVAALYEAFTQEQPSPLEELAIQYADFAVWQREWLTGEVLDRQVSYWKERLAGAPAALELPTDRPRPAAQTFRGQHHHLRLADPLSSALRQFCQQEGVTPFMLLLSAFNLLLWRYTGRRDVVVGSPIANRNHAQTELLIGFFVNTLALRTDLSGNPTFSELLGRVRETCLGAYAHQDIPFEKLVEELKLERSLSHTPLFQVWFVLQNAPQQKLNIRDLEVNICLTESETAKFDLALEVVEEKETLKITFEHNCDLFNAETVVRMAGHLQTLLESVAAHSEHRISELPYLTVAERHQMLLAWNSTHADYPQDKSIRELFETQVEKTPDAVAVVFEDKQLTYQQLNRQANQLANHLQRLGVGREVFAALCVERSVEMVVGVLGVLKAGGAYVALDPTYPKERLSFMLGDTRAEIVLTQAHLVERLPDYQGAFLLLDADCVAIAAESVENPRVSPFIDNPVYVTYTSGSTGKPKGIVMPQRALLNLLEWQYRYSRMPEGSRTIQFASLSFDVSFQDMFSTWCSGGTVVMITEAERRDIAGLSQVLVEKNVHRIFIPAVALQQLAEGFCAEERFSAPLRRIIAGSEQLQITQAIARLFIQLKDCSLHNEYGPSEAHVVTAYVLSGAPEDWPTRPPVGRPISNIQLYLLDKRWQPAPIGVLGELYIGGVSLARGYLNRPELTAAQFVPDPFGEQPGARLYKTGDLARYLPNGDIEFLGRIDHQVKIRGFRVELGEIEATLGQHSSIREAVVLAREYAPGDRRLVAYLVAKPDTALNVSDLRNFVLQKLPEYMVPASFVTLDALPLTPNGKVNRSALPAPEVSRPNLEQSFIAPQTEFEEVLAMIWGDVLGIERVGVYDNFFELGGHSLLATQLVSQLRETFHTELSLKTFFERPTVAGLAESLLQAELAPGAFESIASIYKKLVHLPEVEAKRLLLEERLSA